MTEGKMTFLTEREAAEYLGVSLHTLRTMESEGSLIPFRTLGGHCGYSLMMLNEYLEKTYKPPHHQESENGSEVRDVSLLPVPEIPDQGGSPIDVLNLSTHIYRCLQRSGLHTVAQVAALGQEDLLAIRQLGPKALAEIREKLTAYLAKHPLSDEVEESLLEPEVQAVEPLPPQPPPLPPDPTPLDVLGLSIRPYNALRRSDITSVGQLARMSDEEIRGVRNIGPKSLAEIREKLQVYLPAIPTPATKVAETSAQDKPPSGTPLSQLDIPRGLQEELQAVGVQSIEEVVAYSEEELLLQLDIGYWDMFLLKQGLSQHSLALATKPPLHPLVESHTLAALYERGVPLGEIDIARMALSEGWEDTLIRTGFGKVQELATASEYVLEVACFPWRPDHVAKIKSRLNQYLSWLLQQDSWESEVSGQSVSPIHLIELSETSLEEIVKTLLASLPADRQQDVIKLRYGLFDGRTRSLEEVGQLLGITRERVCQIQQKGLKTLRKPSSREAIKALTEVLEDAFRQAGRLLTEKQIVRIIESHMGIGDIDCRRAVCLVMELDGRFAKVKKGHLWALNSPPLKHVSAVNRLMERLLEAAQVPLSKAELLARFKADNLFLEKDKQELTDEFLVACLNTNRNLEALNGEYYGLKGSGKSRLNRMVMILRALGRPAHYTEIARLTNELLPASKRASDHVIHAQLQRESDVFVLVDRGTYGLKEWGLERPSYYADIIAQVLEGEGHPLPAGEILKRVDEIRPAKESTVMMTLTMHPRFRQVDGETYGLRSWSLPSEDVEERSLPAGFLEDMKQRIFQRLVEQAS